MCWSSQHFYLSHLTHAGRERGKWQCLQGRGCWGWKFLLYPSIAWRVVGFSLTGTFARWFPPGHSESFTLRQGVQSIFINTLTKEVIHWLSISLFLFSEFFPSRHRNGTQCVKEYCVLFITIRVDVMLSILLSIHTGVTVRICVTLKNFFYLFKS